MDCSKSQEAKEAPHSSKKPGNRKSPQELEEKTPKRSEKTSIHTNICRKNPSGASCGVYFVVVVPTIAGVDVVVVGFSAASYCC